MNDSLIIVRLCLSFLLSFIIGFEREKHCKPAGLKTHILVGIASTLVALTSLFMVSEFNHAFDMARLAAGVITGVGFLGAGTIYKDKDTIRGLTTASSLWITTTIGLALGFGFYSGAITTVVLLFITLDLLPKIFKR